MTKPRTQPLNLNALPPPGLDGSYHGSCIACLRGTDTALAFKGEAEWVLAGLMQFGIPLEEADDMMRQVTKSPEGIVPGGDITFEARVCQDCAAKAHLSVELLPKVMLYRQPEESRQA